MMVAPHLYLSLDTFFDYLPVFHLAFDNLKDGMRFRLFYGVYLVVLLFVSRFQLLLQMLPLIKKLASRAVYLSIECR
ncbi:MAG: hypothetical protein QOJ02_3095 [Acidobacteriota bacterium]|nr:hypothetical protein [Acidobacteriota bacterium]